MKRGKTAPGRLAALDAYLVEHEAGLLQRADSEFREAVFLDVGIGESPDTFLEAVGTFRFVAPGLRAVAVDTALHRVQRAKAGCGDFPGVAFRHGGFEEVASVPVRLLRVMNVLREYPPAEVAGIHQGLLSGLLPTGLLVEGSSDKRGGLFSAHLIRKMDKARVQRSLLLYSKFENGFAPLQFRDVLPQDLRRQVKPGTVMGAFFSKWTAAWEEVRANRLPAQAFAASIELLSSREPSVVTTPALWERGYLQVAYPG